MTGCMDPWDDGGVHETSLGVSFLSSGVLPLSHVQISSFCERGRIIVMIMKFQLCLLKYRLIFIHIGPLNQFLKSY